MSKFDQLFGDLPDQIREAENDERKAERKAEAVRKQERGEVLDQTAHEIWTQNLVEKMDVDTRHATEFLFSTRGGYIMAQALFHAIHTMKQVPSQHMERSNISDMEFLQKHLFDFPEIAFWDRDKIQVALDQAHSADMVLETWGRRAVHENHCYQGEYLTSCKYGDENCPQQQGDQNV